MAIADCGAGSRKRRSRIVVDPGHGGTNPGCAYPPLSEKVYSLELAMQLTSKLEAEGHTASLTRWKDETVSFTERARRAHSVDPDLVISLHVNASPSASSHGLQTYYMPDDELARRLAIAIEAQAPTELKRTKNAVIPASLDGEGDDAVLRRYNVPAVLVEVGFASNNADRAYLLSAPGRAALCRAIARGISQHQEELAAIA